MRTYHWRTRIAVIALVTKSFASAFAASGVPVSAQEIEPARKGPTTAPAAGAIGSTTSAQALFESSCIACHGADGAGVFPGVPDLTDQRGSLTQTDDVLAKRILEGFQSPGSTMAMPAKGGNASHTEQDVAKLIDYMRAKFKPQLDQRATRNMESK